MFIPGFLGILNDRTWNKELGTRSQPNSTVRYAGSEISRIFRIEQVTAKFSSGSIRRVFTFLPTKMRSEAAKFRVWGFRFATLINQSYADIYSPFQLFFMPPIRNHGLAIFPWMYSFKHFFRGMGSRILDIQIFHGCRLLRQHCWDHGEGLHPSATDTNPDVDAAHVIWGSDIQSPQTDSVTQRIA